MLKITMYNEPNATRFLLEGRLMGEWVKELERCWLAVADVSLGIRIEFTDVSFIDEPGQALLARMAAAGAALIAEDVHTRAIVEEILATSLPE